MYTIPKDIFNIGIGQTRSIKVGKEKSVRHDKGFLGIKRTVKVKMMDTYPHGCPVGGFGAGTIGRTPDGDFSVWHLATGRHVYETLPACQFHIYMKQGKKKLAQSLSANRPTGRQLCSFRWKYPKGQGTYSALYPRSWFEYTSKQWPMSLNCSQFSPVLPDNYKETSYPVGVYVWRGKNTTKAPVEISIMLTWENIVGWDVTWPAAVHNSEQCFWVKRSGDTVHRLSESPAGVSMILSHKNKPGSFCLSVPKNKKYTITVQQEFDPTSNGSVVWKPFASDGTLADTPVISAGKRNAAAIALKVTLAPGEELEVPFVLAWDLPKHEFKNDKYFYRYYTNFFGTNGKNAQRIAATALKQYARWEKVLSTWQRPYLKRYEPWFASFLFNEMYYLADGGTIWDAQSGDFGLLECFDYFFYETLDVRFYASFPLLRFWPKLELQIMRNFAATILRQDDTFTRFWEYNWKTDIEITEEPRRVYSGPIKVRGACPHDLGSLGHHPLRTMNSYIWRNPNYWKDINAKFVLLIYRDYVNGGKDKKFLRSSWPAVKEALYYLKKMDKDLDGMIENEGFPDQTYDNWTMNGVSAYCATLWIAALEAAVAMAGLLQKKQDKQVFRTWLDKAKPVLDRKLWNGRYYDCYEGCNDIFSDQLVGQWYATLLRLPPVVPHAHAHSALETIYRYNVRTFDKGKMGVVNGRKADGRHCGHEQGDDAWIGTNCFVAGLMLNNGLAKEGWQVLRGVYDVIYNRKGYYFRTPEGYREDGNYVGTMYMRPMAVWSIIK